MYAFITILIVLIGVLLGAVVLIQNPKGGGLSGTFGGVGQQLLGARRSTDIIEKLTWGFAAALLFLCLSTAFVVDQRAASTTKLPASETEMQLKNQPPPTQPQGGQPAGTGNQWGN